MNTSNIFPSVKEKAEKWLIGNFDAETKNQVKHLLENDHNELIESFYQDLEFGTGGLRGIMGVGTNRMNIYTVGMATQGLSNYLKSQFPDILVKVAIAYDSRNNSRLFAETTANVFSANGFKVFLFESLRPTPELSFAIRHLGCQSGVVITASHNPKEYNGYKAYWSDGGQIISPHDKNIIAEVQKISSIDEVSFNGDDKNIEMIGYDLDMKYLSKIKALSLAPDIIEKNRNLKIIYTPLHGAGVHLVPEILKKFGFNDVKFVPEQMISDGNFPTVVSPNPEVPAALSMAIERAKDTDAELVLATDPDADRVGIAVRDNMGEFILLNGNQTASLLFNYIISMWSENGKLKGKEYIVKTIVTSELLVDIAKKYKVEYFDVLTGFKYIADVMLQNEGKKQFICGGEESYGYLAGDFVRDKDAIMACALIAEAAASAKNDGKSLFDKLVDIYIEFGFYKESLVNVEKHGKAGAEEIQKMMQGYRTNPPKMINNSKVNIIKDYSLLTEHNLISGQKTDIHLPKSNVLQFFLEDGSKISVRPSGTEPKIKYYIGVKGHISKKEEYNRINIHLDEKVKKITVDMNLL